jgi:uroporphyrin-III C-methyltransferase
MSASEPTPASPAPAASEAPAPASGERSKTRAPRHRSGVAGLALVLALFALVAAGWGGWKLWQLQKGGNRDSQALQSVETRLQSLEHKLDAQASANQALQQQVQSASQQAQNLGTQVQGLGERSRSLENAVAGLSARARSGHDAIRLDEAAMLLRMAGERFALFHDTDGAMRAYAMADKVLGEVEDPAYAGVRQSIAAERKALANTHPGRRQSDLDTLSRLRTAVDTLPLKAQGSAPKSASSGFWARVGHAFSRLVQVRRDDELTPARRDLARTLTALDLAQAQAALLAWDMHGYRQALDRADARVQHDFDAGAEAVRDMHAQIAQLRQQSVPNAPQLGAALQELDNLRAVHEASEPAPAASAPVSGGAQR